MTHERTHARTDKGLRTLYMQCMFRGINNISVRNSLRFSDLAFVIFLKLWIRRFQTTVRYTDTEIAFGRPLLMQNLVPSQFLHSSHITVKRNMKNTNRDVTHALVRCHLPDMPNREREQICMFVEQGLGLYFVILTCMKIKICQFSELGL